MHFKLACLGCVENQQYHTASSNICDKDKLIAKHFETNWCHVRDRVFQTYLNLPNTICNGFPTRPTSTAPLREWDLVYERSVNAYDPRINTLNGNEQRNDCKCNIPDDVCPIPHNKLEELLWHMEAKGEFDVFRKIEEMRSELPGLAQGSYFRQKYPGDFEFICDLCLEHQLTETCKHDASKRLVYFPCKKNKKTKLVISLNSDSKMCERLKFCWIGDCSKSHSFLEKDLRVLFQMSSELSPEQIVMSNLECNKRQNQRKEPKCGDCRSFCQLMYSTFYCYFCHTFCNSRQQLLEHCNNMEHISNVHTDEDFPWKYPSSPFGDNQTSDRR